MKYCILLLLLICKHCAWGQSGVIGIPIQVSDRFIYIYDLGDSVTLDHTKLSVAYRLSFVRDTIKNEKWEDRIVLQIGGKINKQFSAWAYQIDSMSTMRKKYDLYGNWMSIDEATEKFKPILKRFTTLPPAQLWFATSADDFRFYSTHSEIIRYLESEKMVSINPEPASLHASKGFQFEESTPAIDWDINHSDTMDIVGYSCRKATARYAGRSYVAWYTPQLPINAGPYKFTGLPGLILKIHDAANQYDWHCVSIDVQSRPIVKYRNKFPEVTKKQFTRWERNAYANPEVVYRNNNMKVKIYDPQADRHYTPAEINWSIPYNPIERE